MSIINIKDISKFKIPTIDEIISALSIKKGDTVHFSSDMAVFCEIYEEIHNDFSLGKILNSLKESVGENGTLILPTYSWDFCHGKGFDIRKTQSKTGSLSKYALKSGFKRTKHPIYSYAVWGKDSAKYLELENIDGWGDDSPFALMLKNNGFWIQFCVPVVHSNTFWHYPEKHFGAKHRYNKEFSDFYIDENGVKSKRTYTMYVRDLSWRDPISPDEWENLMASIAEIDINAFNLPIRKYSLEKIFNLAKEKIESRYYF